MTLQQSNPDVKHFFRFFSMPIFSTELALTRTGIGKICTTFFTVKSNFLRIKIQLIHPYEMFDKIDFIYLFEHFTDQAYMST